MDKNTITGLVLIGILLVGFSFLSRPSEEQIAAQKRYYDSIAVVQQQEEALRAKTEAALANEKEETAADSASLFFSATKGKEAFTTIQNNLVEITLDNKGGRVYSALLKNYMGQDKKPVVLFNGSDASMNFNFYNKKGALQTKDFYFEAVNKTDSSVTMRLAADSASYIDFIYTLKPDNYLMSFVIKATGMDGKLAASTNYVDISWSQRARQIEKGYTYENRLADLTYKYTGDDVDNLSASKDDEKSVSERLDWIAFKNQFFSSVLIADQDFDKASLTSTPQQEGSGYMKNYTADMTTFFDPTGKQPTDMQFYFGPNHFKTLLNSNDLSLSQKDLELEDLVYLGWPIIRWVNRWFTINLFDWLSGWGLSMGVVLLLMTIIVKVLVYPATYKSYMSSAKMRVLKPYINEINAKYPKKEDALKKQQETMALYSKYGVSPMGGCLPMLIQMPVFMALFFFVPNAIELRQQSFLWAPDLSTYDDIINWGTNIPLLGNHLSLFCLLFSITNILNTMYTMKQQDMGQQQMPGMKLMMYIMPVMFIFIFNGYSSGLNYYYFISGLIGILTMVILLKTTDEKKLLAMLEARKEKKSQKNGGKPGGGLMAKLEALQKEQERLQQERMNKGKK